MKRKPVALLVVGLMVCLVGCGGAADPPTTPDPVALSVDDTSPVDPTSAVIGTWHPEPWMGIRDDGRIRLTANPIVGDEASERFTLVFVDTSDPLFVTGRHATSAWDGADGTIETSQTISASQVQLTTWDPDGLISGRVVASADNDGFTGEFEFWVDLAAPPRQANAGELETVSLGQMVAFEGHWFQISRIEENSLCPPETQCVWEGQLVYVLEDRYWAEPRAFVLSGWRTEDGGVFGGTEPSVTLPDEDWIRITVIGFSDDPAPAFRVLFEELNR